MFSRSFFIVAALAVCFAQAELSTYIPAVLYTQNLKANGAIKTPFKAGSKEPRNLAAELNGQPLKKEDTVVFILESRGLNAKMLSEFSSGFMDDMPTVSAEAAYTHGADISAFEKSFGCSGDAKLSLDEMGSFLESDKAVGSTVAVCVQGEEAILDAYQTIYGSRRNSVIVLTGSTTPVTPVVPTTQTTLWPAGVVEVVISFIAVSVPLILSFHLLCSIRPVEDVEYPKHKVSS